jgi:hypothetical protein
VIRQATGLAISALADWDAVGAWAQSALCGWYPICVRRRGKKYAVVNLLLQGIHRSTRNRREPRPLCNRCVTAA